MIRTIFCVAACCSMLLCSGLSIAQGASNKTYLELMEIQELWDAKDYPTALARLEAYSAKIAGNTNDLAVVLPYIAHTYVFMDQIDKARQYLEKALALPELDTEVNADIRLMYGQILLSDDEFELAVQSLEFWYANTTKERPPSVVFSLGYANYMIKILPRAEELLLEAINLSSKPKTSWYRVYYETLFDQKKYKRAEEVLMGMVSRDPGNADNWRILANHHLKLEDGRAALSTIAIAYQNGWLEGAADLQRMISLYSAVDVPEKAARLLETHTADDQISRDAETLKRLGDLWLLARERGNAKRVLEEAASIAPDGRTYELLGNIYFEDESWRAAHDAFIKAINSGGLDKPARIYFLAGVCAQRGGMKDEARKALKAARNSEEFRSQANSLLKKLDKT